MLTTSPFRLNESSLSANTARPLNRPEGLLSTTRPLKMVPLGTITRSPDTSGSSSSAVKRSPERLRWVSMVSCKRTRKAVPASSVTGGGAGGVAGAPAAGFVADGLLGSLAACTDFRLHAPTNNNPEQITGRMQFFIVDLLRNFFKRSSANGRSNRDARLNKLWR